MQWGEAPVVKGMGTSSKARLQCPKSKHRISSQAPSRFGRVSKPLIIPSHYPEVGPGGNADDPLGSAVEWSNWCVRISSRGLNHRLRPIHQLLWFAALDRRSCPSPSLSTNPITSVSGPTSDPGSTEAAGFEFSRVATQTGTAPKRSSAPTL